MSLWYDYDQHEQTQMVKIMLSDLKIMFIQMKIRLYAKIIKRWGESEILEIYSKYVKH